MTLMARVLRQRAVAGVDTDATNHFALDDQGLHPKGLISWKHVGTHRRHGNRSRRCYAESTNRRTVPGRDPTLVGKRPEGYAGVRAPANQA